MLFFDLVVSTIHLSPQARIAYVPHLEKITCIIMPDTEVIIINFTYSTQLGIKFILSINFESPTIARILILMNRVNVTRSCIVQFEIPLILCILR